MDKKILFIHIPKTAGSSINNSPIITRVDDKIHPFRNSIIDKIAEIGAEGHYKFCFVRDPYARLYSLYNYFYKMDESHIYFKYNHHVCEVVKRYATFERFVKALASLRILNNFHFYEQTSYIYHGDKRIVDFVGKVETIDEDINRLADILGLPIRIKLPLKNVSTQKGSYINAYTEETRKITRQIYMNDFQLLDYQA